MSHQDHGTRVERFLCPPKRKREREVYFIMKLQIMNVNHFPSSHSLTLDFLGTYQTGVLQTIHTKMCERIHLLNAVDESGLLRLSIFNAVHGEHIAM
jgi:hypothetical protein